MIDDSQSAPWLLMLQRVTSLENAVVRFGRDVENDGLPLKHPVIQKGLNVVGAIFEYREALTQHLVTPDEEMKEHGN